MKYLLSIFTLLTIFSCQAVNTENTNASEKNIGMPNPASVYCVKQGGESIIKKDSAGNSYGVCKFKDGKEVDEWQYFRENNQK